MTPLPHPTNILHTKQLPPLPSSWSELTWPQLCAVWTAKIRYGGNPDVAVCAALLALCQLTADGTVSTDPATGETVYQLKGKDGQPWTVAPRQLSHLAHKALPWFAYPYGDAGDKEERDDQGKVVKERREGHQGYVNPDVGNWRDAMMLTEETVAFCGRRMMAGSEWEAMGDGDRREAVGREWDAATDDERREVIGHELPGTDEKTLRRMARKDWAHTGEELRRRILRSPHFIRIFALPSTACYNITWHQYRTLQALVPQLFAEATGDDDALQLQAQFMAYITVPSPWPLPDGDPFPPRNSFKYVSERAEAAVAFWRQMLASETGASVLYYICFQMWQTATINYYPSVFPLLFGSNSTPSDPLQTALTNESGTINAVMKYQGYANPQDVYDANLPIILGVLHNMTKEAKEIEKMNQQIKSKRK